MSRAASFVLGGTPLNLLHARRTAPVTARSESTSLNKSQSTRPEDNDPLPEDGTPTSRLDQLLLNNQVLSDFTRRPRHKLLLAHGLYGFDVLGPSAYPKLQLHYWSTVIDILRNKIGAEVIVTGVPSVGSIESRAQRLHEQLCQTAHGESINFIAHSMGGLDCRHLITHVQPQDPRYKPVSLTTICTPHHGSPFMDWCKANIGIGALRDALDHSSIRPSLPNPALPYTLKNPLLSRSSRLSTPLSDSASGSEVSSDVITTLASRLSTLPASLTTLILSMVDTPAYADLTTDFCEKIFNPRTPMGEDVKYFSVAARKDKMSILHPLWLPKLILDETEAAERSAYLESCRSRPPPYDNEPDWGSDGLVSVRSARYGNFLGVVENADHWDTRGAQGFSKIWETDAAQRGGWAEFFGWREGGERDAIEKAINDDGVQAPVPKRVTETPNRSSLPTQSEIANTGGTTQQRSQRERDQAKFSAALKWIADSVPTQAAVSAVHAVQSSLVASLSNSRRTTPVNSTPTKPPKFDLESFYIALARNLYEEGL